jgi:hypothetical protein
MSNRFEDLFSKRFCSNSNKEWNDDLTGTKRGRELLRTKMGEFKAGIAMGRNDKLVLHGQGEDILSCALSAMQSMIDIPECMLPDTDKATILQKVHEIKHTIESGAKGQEREDQWNKSQLAEITQERKALDQETIEEIKKEWSHAKREWDRIANLDEKTAKFRLAVAEWAVSHDPAIQKLYRDIVAKGESV